MKAGLGLVAARLIAMPAAPDRSPLDHKHVLAVNVIAAIGFVVFSAWSGAAFVVGFADPVYLWIAAQNAVAAAAFAGVVVLNRRDAPTAAAVLLHVVAFVQAIFAIVMFGYVSNAHFMFVALIIAPFLAFPRRRRALAAGFALLAGIGLFTAFLMRESLQPLHSFISGDFQGGVNLIATVVGISAIAYAFQRFIDRTEDDLLHEQARSEHLLLNVLPASIVGRLKDHPDTVIADRYSHVTVLFADIVGFSEIASRATPEETVHLLSTIYSAFDEICERHGVEKLRTMGDGYLAMAGAPVPLPEPEQAMVRAAVEMRDWVASASLSFPVALRIGLHAGEVAAGIIGRRRFQYDIWGDTVNVAARMEETSEPGRIQISDPLHRLIGGTWPCVRREPIEIKGKGRMQTWFLA